MKKINDSWEKFQRPKMSAIRIYSNTFLSSALRKQIYLHGSPHLVEICQVYPEDNRIALYNEIKFPFSTTNIYQEGVEDESGTFHKIGCNKKNLVPWHSIHASYFRPTYWLPWNIQKGDLIWFDSKMPFIFQRYTSFPVYMA